MLTVRVVLLEYNQLHKKAEFGGFENVLLYYITSTDVMICTRIHMKLLCKHAIIIIHKLELHDDIM